MSDKAAQGSVHGRFQGVHLDHEKYILEAKSRCTHLFVGLVSPLADSAQNQASPARRYDPDNNPFSYLERCMMIRACLLGAGWRDADYTIHPFPIDQPRLIPGYLPPPAEIKLYLNVYSDWSHHKAQVLEQLGYQVELLNQDLKNRQATGSELRRRLRNGDDFGELVSPEVAAVIGRLNLQSKLGGQSPPA